MNKRQLGKTDLQIAPLVLGTNVFGWTINEATSFEILDGFAGAGFNLIDTADVYSAWAPGNKGGESETIIGNWMKKRNNRSAVLIATKVGSDMGAGKKGVTKKYILQAVEDSLRRLQTDYIDLYQTHFDDEATPVDEASEAYDVLVKAGKVRWTGTSNMSAERLLKSLEVSKKNGYPQYQGLQPEYNLYAREKFETVYEQICLDNNMGVINYYALASGFLTGKYRSEKDFSKSVRGGGMKKYLDKRGLAILDAMDVVAERHNANATGVALAWLMARPSITAPIASATSTAQLNDLIKAATLVLTADDIALLDKASAWK
jgi:aryl-alcohol dehydrogenase-like predicted oxidoreductase